MKRGDTGPAGAAALILVLLVQASSLASLLTSAQGAALAVTALVASRVAPAVLCRKGVPSARPGGLGDAVAGTVDSKVLAAVAVVLVVAATACSWALDISPYAAGLVVVAALVSAWVVSRHTQRRLGGITGDVIGAAIEISLASSLVVAAALAGSALV
jgi:adenosylcobinamide-GDP ribazoletransferase